MLESWWSFDCYFIANLLPSFSKNFENWWTLWVRKLIASSAVCTAALFIWTINSPDVRHMAGKNNNNSTHANVYGAVIVIKATAKVHPVNLMNADWAPGWLPTPDQADRLGCESANVNGYYHPHPPSPFVIITQLILILPSHGGWKA